MANDLNRHECIGRLGQSVEVKYTPSGEAVTNISVACTKSWKDKNGEKQERTEWIRYVAFGKLAELMGRYLDKGSRVYLSGSLRTRKWQGQDGQDRYTTEIVASEMQMLDSRGDGQTQQSQQGQSQAQQQPAQNQGAVHHHQQAPQGQAPTGGFDDFEDDGIPF